MYEMIISVTSMVLSSAISIFALFFTAHRENQNMLRKSKIEQIEKLYLPFYKNCVLMFYPKYQFSELDEKAQNYFEESIFKNIQFGSTRTQMYYIEFHKLWMNSPSRTNDNVTDSNVDAAFKKLYDSVISEYIYLCKKTKLPAPPLQS